MYFQTLPVGEAKVSLVLRGTGISCLQGHIKPPKAARGHATSYSARIDSIMLNVTKNSASG